ncbi:MAG: WecB/TagA/CpsF family glycosyltransferase [Eisenbergiella sp.]
MNYLPYTEILKTKIDITTMDEAVSWIDEHLEELSGKYVCISNVHTTVTAYRDEKYREVQNGSALSLPDGKPLSIVQRYRGYENAGRVPGPDLMPEIFALSEKKGYRHYFYGSKQSTLDALKERLLEKYPKLNIVGMYSPPFRPLTEEEDQEAVERINAVKPDFIWVGLGAPKQEIWMAEHENRVHGVMLGVGAGFDFHAGTIKRAPKWMQELCMEWLYRISQDPKRLLWRYLDTNFSFLWYLWKEKCQNDKREHKKSLKIAMIGHKRIPSREGGVEIVVDELSTRYVKLGHRVDAYNRCGTHVSGKKFDEARGKSYKGVRLIQIPTFKNSTLNAPVYSVLATFRALFGRYDVIHYHAEGPCMMLWLPKLFGKHVVATIHGLDWQRSKWEGLAVRVLKFGEKMAAKYADDVIVLSKNVQEYFRENYGRETVFIPNGVNRPTLRKADMIRSQYGLEKDSYILFLARIVPEKGLHYLIEAYQQVETDKRLVIAGGVSHSREYMEQIHAMAAKDSRILMTDFVQGQVLEELCSNAYLFVLPSDVEGMAVSLLEAMSYGNCCLVSDIKENTEVVETHAVTFRKGDISDLREKLKELLEDQKYVDNIKLGSMDFICSKYDWDCVVKETLNLYYRRN